MTASEETARFLRGLAHELRTPLGSILILTELLEDGPEPLSASQGDRVRKIGLAAADLKELVEQVSVYAKAADGRLAATPSAVDLEALVGELRQAFAERARARGLELAVEWRPEAPRSLATDREILRRALSRLLEHAVGATAEGRIELGVAREAGEAVLTVRDGGSPVAADERAALFEPFPPGVRIRRSSGGTALALPLAKALAGVLGGRLEARDAGGRGCLFTLSLPLTVAGDSG